MLLFRSEENVADWCRINELPQGALLTMAQVWDLSQAWYGDRLSADYAGRTAAEAKSIFDSVGLSGPFWSLAPEL